MSTYQSIDCDQGVVFARISSKKQEHGVSTETQIEALETYCDKHGINIIHQFDITESSTRGKRPEFWKMLKFIESQSKKTAIVVHGVDRLQRRYHECVALEKLLSQDKIEIHFYKEGLVLHKDSSYTDIMRWDMGILSAKLYIGAMKEAVKRAQKFNWSQGRWQGLAKIGYLNARDDYNKPTLIIDEERAPIIKKLFEEYATGNHSVQSIWEIAKEMGLRSKEPNHFKRSKNYKKAVCVSRNKIYDMLIDPFYYGTMKIKDELIPHIYEPLIDRALFDKVQNILKGRKRVRSKEAYGTAPFVFRGLIRCSECGCAMTAEKHTKKSGLEFTYLKCGRKRGPCSQSLVNEKVLLEQLDRELFGNMRLTANMLELLKKNVRKQLDEEGNFNASLKRKITNDLKALEEKEGRLFDFYLNGKIDEAKHNIEKAKIEAERTELQRTSEKYAVIGKEIKDTVECVMDIAGNAPLLMKTATINQQRELLALLLSDCTLEGKTLKYILNKPFDKLLTVKDPKEWQSIPTDSLEVFIPLSNPVSRFKHGLKK